MIHVKSKILINEKYVDQNNVSGENTTIHHENIKYIINSLFSSFTRVLHKKQVKDVWVNSNYCIKKFFTAFSNHEVESQALNVAASQSIILLI